MAELLSVQVHVPITKGDDGKLSEKRNQVGGFTRLMKKVENNAVASSKFNYLPKRRAVNLEFNGLTYSVSEGRKKGRLLILSIFFVNADYCRGLNSMLTSLEKNLLLNMLVHASVAFTDKHSNNSHLNLNTLHLYVFFCFFSAFLLSTSTPNSHDLLPSLVILHNTLTCIMEMCHDYSLCSLFIAVNILNPFECLALSQLLISDRLSHEMLSKCSGILESFPPMVDIYLPAH